MSTQKQRLHLSASEGSINLPEIGLRGTGLHPITAAECVDFVLDELDAGRGGWLMASNLDHLRRVRLDPDFKQLYASATLRVATGKALDWACRLQRTPLPACLTLEHLLDDMTREAGVAGRRIFIICETEELSESAVQALGQRYGEVKLAGSAGIALGNRNADLIEFARIGRAILKADPDLIYVGLSSPFQERLISFLRRDRPNSWWIGFGQEIKRLALAEQLATTRMSRFGLAWLQRICERPGPLFKHHVLRGLPSAVTLLGSCLLSGMLPKAKRASRYGRRRPRALLVDDDEHALAHLELLLSMRFPHLEIHTRTDPDVSGGYEFYFIDNDFNGRLLASQLASHIREAKPESMIFAFSGVLDVDTLKGLINVGCDGVCDKSDPKSWSAILEMMDDRFQKMVQKNTGDKHAFGGIRGSANSIQRLLKHWNQTPLGVDTEAEKQSG